MAPCATIATIGFMFHSLSGPGVIVASKGRVSELGAALRLRAMQSPKLSAPRSLRGACRWRTIGSRLCANSIPHARCRARQPSSDGIEERGGIGFLSVELDEYLQAIAVRSVEEATRAIPVIDFGPAFRREPGGLDAAAADVRHACEKVFFYMAGHGVSQAVIDAAFEASREFHAMPLEDKMRLKLNETTSVTCR